MLPHWFVAVLYMFKADLATVLNGDDRTLKECAIGCAMFAA